jgi:hypothetical protein
LKNPKALFKKPYGKAVLVVAAVLALSGIIRRKFTKVDIFAFASLTAALTVFEDINAGFKSWITKAKTVRDGILKHSTPINKNYFFNNRNLADRVTLLGVAINIVLSISKFVGGIGNN